MLRKYLRRYTDLPSLMYLLTERKITLLDPESWDDANDSHYMSLYRDAQKVRSVLALCFTQTTEQYGHWRVFANGASGVCITFKRADLLRAVQKARNVRVGRVTYLKLGDFRRKRLKSDRLPFVKRYPFRQEHEFRMIWTSSSSKSTCDIPIPLTCIDRITLSPWLNEAVSKRVKRMLWDIEGCRKLDITRSTLISNEEWKYLGESVAAGSIRSVSISLRKPSESGSQRETTRRAPRTK